ncbi:AAA family ATPase [Thomasclavelia cocleata]|uniref:AAA family ATPase n=2 Tax=Thomasclavelia cocleata TaxID=69824 RepID=UPI00248C1537|nr:AAA family ATPase [Thomasclavelia cocleata]
MIEYTNKVINTNMQYVCVSRPRRFGKSTDANMLVAYYSKGCDSLELFDNLKISETELYQKHLNQHNVIHLNMQDFLSETYDVEKMIQLVNDSLIWELLIEYKDLLYFDKTKLVRVLNDIYSQTHKTFIFIIDEWDCIFREYSQNKEAQNQYLDFLRNLLKEKPYIELAYMTGILPIKKYGTHSALNMFDEISMIDPGIIYEFMGFTEKEVKNLCAKYDVSFDILKQWYDGYQLTKEISVFSPRSVVASITRRIFNNYWTSTETYEALQIYIDMNFDGLKDDIIRLLSGEKVNIQTTSFQNDMTSFKSKDDVFTLLVHLGYLAYNQDTKEVCIPNKEVIDSFVQSVKNSSWGKTTTALINSDELLKATWNLNEEKVAYYIEQAYLETSLLQYNDENALSYTISLAYYRSRDFYTIVKELPARKGFADMVFIPKGDKPAMIIELKWNQEVETAITQIKGKEYYFGLEKYLYNLLLIGITYDKDSKKHICQIEKYEG